MRKANWEKDKVYLFQFRRAKCFPSISPFCIKLETWLRFANIPYENVDTGAKIWSKRGTRPFIEINGKEISDSNTAIDELTKQFGKEDILNEAGKHMVYVYEKFVEDSVFCIFLQNTRLPNLEKTFYGSDFAGDVLPKTMKRFKPIILMKLRNTLKSKTYHHGIGRFSKEEVDVEAEKCFKALASKLGDKPFMMGDKPTRLDMTVFGMLALVYYLPIEHSGKSILLGCENLPPYLDRIKSLYWPDWKEACENLQLNTEWMSHKTEE